MNGHSNIDANEATEHLKNILNVGKSESAQGNKAVNSMSAAKTDEIHRVASFQKVELNGDEKDVLIHGTDVTVFSSPLLRGVNSSNIILNNIVDYGWEQKYYLGCLVSIHLSKKYLAYALKPPALPHGFVRIIKHSTNSHLLIKSFKGSVQDLSFAHSLSRIMLGCVDEIGDLFVYQIYDQESTLTHRLCLHIVRPENTPSSIYHRITWCPYVPEDISDNIDIEQDDVMMSSLLVVTHDEKAEIWNVDIVMKEYGTGDIPFGNVQTGLQFMREHQEPITAAAFSPDAIALATASLDGQVKFFQVNIHQNDVAPKCLHVWIPHNTLPLSSLFFLDNHRDYSSDVQFWKYAITGADNNQELKIWSCKTWSCLQTIRILPSETDHISPCLKAEIDLTAGYLVLSDINRKVLYIMKISQDNDASICSLSEFVVKYPVLSFSVMDIVPYKGKSPINSKVSGDEDEDEDEDEKDDGCFDLSNISNMYPSYLVKLFWIHTKSFQACRILYSPKYVPAVPSKSSQDSSQQKDGYSNLNTDVPDQLNMSDHIGIMRSQQTEIGISPNKCNHPAGVLASPSVLSPVASPLPPCLSPSYQECTEILLTPKDFTSHHSDLSPVGITNSYVPDVEELPDQITSTEVIGHDEITGMDSQRNNMPRRKSSQHSCASSPSREVAEILSPSEILTHDDRDESPPVKDDAGRSSDDLQGTVTCRSPIMRQQTSDWPQAPDLNKEYKVVQRNDGENHLPHPSMKQNSLRPTLADGDISPDDVLDDDAKSGIQGCIEALSMKVSSFSETLQMQIQAIQFVQGDIQKLQQQQKYIQNVIQCLETLDNVISSKVAHIISEKTISDFSRLEAMLSKRSTEDLQRCEQQSAAISEDIVSTVSSQLDKVLKQEMKNTLIPHMSNYLDTLVHQLQGEFLQKLNSTDSALKECLGKHLRSKAFGDNLATAAVTLLQQSIQTACKDVFQNNVMPSLDKCCQLLFSQMNEVFSKGSLEYVEKLDRHFQMASAHQEAAAKRFDDQIQKLTVDTQAILNRISAKTQENASEAAQEREKLLTQIRHVVQEEVHRSLSEQSSSSAIAGGMRSRQSTPAPQSDPQFILQLAKQGKINEAFQQALSAVDVKLVLFLCESVSVDQVFEPVPCPLAQHVLLSLIQQLSGELNEKTELKLRYIEDAVASLDDGNPVTKEHIGRVLGSLKQRIVMFMKVNPSHKMIRVCKRVYLAIDSLLK